VRRLATFCTLLALSAGTKAELARTPFLIFREADSQTEKRIKRELIAEKTLGGLAPETRRQAREELAWIGPWCVPYLETAIRKQSSARIRMNSVLALAMIRDPRGLPVLREAAKKDRDLDVRRAATLAIGLFEWDEDVATLRALPEGEWRAIAPALARLRSKAAAAILKGAVADLPKKYEQDSAAILLSAAIAGPDAPLVEHLENREDLIQQAAALGLAVRPLPAHRAGEIIAALKGSKLCDAARVLAIRALGAIEDRPPEVQEKLLDLAWKDGKEAERIAALLELRGTPDEVEKLLRAYAREGRKNDPVVAALFLALARTRDPEALDKLRSVLGTGSDFLKFYAGASLLCVFPALDDGTRAVVQGPLRELKGTAYLEELAKAANRVIPAKREDQEALAREVLRDLDAPRHLELFFSPEERTWREVNRMLTRIFDIDPVLLQFDAQKLQDPDSPLGGVGGGGEETRKPASGRVADQDLSDLLVPPRVDAPEGHPRYPERRPYFGPEDVGVG